MIGIYKITNKINNKCYIGQSIDILKRWNGHVFDLTNKSHANNHLQSSFDKYGLKNFTFEIIELCNEESLNDKEIYYIDKYKSYDTKYGFNKSIGGGYSRRLSNKEIIEIINILKNNPYYSKEKLSKKYDISVSTIYGIIKDNNLPKPKKIINDEYRNKISTTLKGRKLSKSHKNNIKQAVSKNHGYSKFSEDQIKEVIDLLLKGYDNIQIKEKTNVSYIVINNIRNKKNWISLTKNIDFPKVKASNKSKGNSKLNDDQVIQIINLMLEGFTDPQISKKLNISYTMVRGIRCKKTYKHITEKYDIPINKQKNQFA